MRPKCPKCVKALPLQFRQIDGGPKSYCCNTCEGKFLSATHYIDWQQRLGALSPEKPAGAGSFDFDDSVRAMMCPACSGIMLKYRAKNDLPFHLDFCRRCNGVWLDKNEWDALFARNLHDEINFMFTDGWQAKLNREKLEQRLVELFSKRIGAESYERVADFRTWLKTHEHKSEIVAYLSESLVD
jgi:Zn-finger nucleic acid-binding protein